MKKALNKFIVLFFTLFTLGDLKADEKKIREFFYNFDGHCVQNITDLQRIRDIAAQDWAPLPEELHVYVRPKNQGQGFGAWYFGENIDTAQGFKDNAYFIAINDPDNANVCSLVSLGFIYSDELMSLLSAKYKLSKVHEAHQGIQSNILYNMNIYQAPKAMLGVVYSKEPGLEAMNLSIIADR